MCTHVYVYSYINLKLNIYVYVHIILTHTKEIILLYELHTIEGWKCISYAFLLDLIVVTVSANICNMM